MHAAIQSTSQAVLDFYRSQRAWLGQCSTAELVDLQHECDGLRFDQDFSVRTAAEINRTACLLILEERNADLSGAK